MIAMRKGRMKASFLKSEGDVRSHTRYHFVYGTVGRLVCAENEATGATGDGDNKAGEGSGAPAKSANPVVIQCKYSDLSSYVWLWSYAGSLYVPASSPAGTGDGDGFPPRIF